MIYLFKFRVYAAYVLRYMYFRSSSGLESAIVNCYFRSGFTVFAMCPLDRGFKDLSNDVLHAILFAV